MNLQSLIFVVVAGIAFGISTWRIVVLYRMMRAHNPKAPFGLHRLDHIPERIRVTIANVLGQKAVLKDRRAGIMHTMIFWGFIVITVGTLEQFVSTLFPGVNFEFIGPALYRVLVFTQDSFAFLVLAAVGYACYRRFVLRPAHLGQSRDANLILLFTGALMVSIFLMNAFHIVADQPYFASAMPLSKWISSLFGAVPPDTAATLHVTFKWTHMLIVLGFSVYIPGSKHLHVIAAGPNTFLQTLKREKGMKPIAFEDESITQYGAAKISDLSWKDALDYFSCTECGRCQALCPAWNTQKPLSPKNLIVDLKHNLYGNKAAVLAGNRDGVTPVIDSHVTEDVIWACTSCRACEIACPVFIEHTDKIFEIRRNLVMMESKFPTEVQTVFKNMETQGTPWAFSASDRSAWADGLQVPTIQQSADGAASIDVLLWVGCAGSYDDRNKKVLKAFVNLLKRARIRFAILGPEEKCTGDPARRIGNEYLFQTLAKSNVETLNKYQVKKIVTACPHCFNTLKNEYPDFGGKFDVVHHSQFLAQLIKEGKLRPSQASEETIAYHDSCYMGRWNGEYDAPRDILKSIPGVKAVEMSSHHDQSLCCGAGGGRMWMEEKTGERINVKRTEQALETGAGVVASSCPFCMTMISDGVKTKDMADKVRVVDIAELLDHATTTST